MLVLFRGQRTAAASWSKEAQNPEPQAAITTLSTTCHAASSTDNLRPLTNQPAYENHPVDEELIDSYYFPVRDSFGRVILSSLSRLRLVLDDDGDGAGDGYVGSTGGEPQV